MRTSLRSITWRRKPAQLPGPALPVSTAVVTPDVRPKASASMRAEIAHDWLKRVGLGKAANKKPAELSQGMQQRVGIARAFALRPKMLLLDEPFGMLDSLTRLELQDVLLDVWSTHQTTTLMVTHDVDEAVMLSDRIVMMTNGPAATIGDILTIPFERPRIFLKACL